MFQHVGQIENLGLRGREAKFPGIYLSWYQEFSAPTTPIAGNSRAGSPIHVPPSYN